MKIVYCLNSISETGGIERITIAKANALAEIESNAVYILVTDYHKRWPATTLSSKVSLIDLGIKYYERDWKSRLYVWSDILIKRLRHKEKLKNTLYKLNPDIVISVGQAEKYMLTSIGGDWKLIREIHYIKNYRRLSLKDNQRIGKILARLSDLYDFNYKIKKYDRIVVLTEEELKQNWSSINFVSVIPNFISDIPELQSSLNNKKIISAGRLEYQKNFSSLILAFKIVAEEFPDWNLEIYGDGSERSRLDDMIEKLNLKNNVFLKGKCENLQERMLKASVFVMSSRFEGFPMVMLEALSCGLPIVTYDFSSGPKDILENGNDGYIVSLGDETSLANKIIELIKNEKNRKKMGENAYLKAMKFHKDIIIKQWMDLFDALSKS